MAIILKLILGLGALFLITFATFIFGMGGFFFVLGLFAVLLFAFARRTFKLELHQVPALKQKPRAE
jgi:hypothetical protein